MRDEVKHPEGPVSSLLVGSKTASREKSWDECGIEEKVERLRRVMQQQQHMVRSAWNTASAAQELARQHQHNNMTGEVLSAVNRHGSAGEAMGRSFDPLA